MFKMTNIFFPFGICLETFIWRHRGASCPCANIADAREVFNEVHMTNFGKGGLPLSAGGHIGSKYGIFLPWLL